MLCEPLRNKNKLINCLPIHKGNTLEHERTKFEVAYWLKNNGYDFYSEVTLKNGKRPDLLVVGVPDPFAVEIVHTESAESIEVKKAEYGVHVLALDTKVDVAKALSSYLG